MKEDSRISVIVPTYNHQAFISDALESVLRQDTTELREILVMDDCSTDDTVRICRKYKLRAPDLIDVRVQERNKGFRKNTIAGLAACSGEFIAWLDGDDYWLLDNKLSHQLAQLDARKDASLSFSASFEIHGSDNVVFPVFGRSEFNVVDLLGFDFIPTCTVLMRRSSLTPLPCWLEDMPVIDWPLFLHAALSGPLLYSPQVAAVRRIHDKGVWSRLSPDMQDMAIAEIYDALILHLPPWLHSSLESARHLRRPVPSNNARTP